MPNTGMRAAYLQFAPDSGRVTGSGGCNRISGPFTRDGDRLQLGPIVSTRMACADGRLNQQEVEFLSALESTNRYAIAGDTLTLLRDDEPLARLRAAPR